MNLNFIRTCLVLVGVGFLPTLVLADDDVSSIDDGFQAVVIDDPFDEHRSASEDAFSDVIIEDAELGQLFLSADGDVYQVTISFVDIEYVEDEAGVNSEN